MVERQQKDRELIHKGENETSKLEERIALLERAVFFETKSEDQKETLFDKIDLKIVELKREMAE